MILPFSRTSAIKGFFLFFISLNSSSVYPMGSIGILNVLCPLGFVSCRGRFFEVGDDEDVDV